VDLMTGKKLPAAFNKLYDFLSIAAECKKEHAARQ